MNNKISEVIALIKSEISLNAEGKATFSIRATARICDVSDKSLRVAFASANQTPSKLAETLIQKGFTPAELTTFANTGIPDLAVATIVEYYALDADRYCTEQAKLVLKAFVAIGIRTWAQNITNWSKPETKTSTNELMETANKAIDLIFSNVPIKPELIAGIKLNATQQLCPELKDVLEPSRQLLINNTAQPHQLLTPTDIGKRRGLSARRVNEILIEKELQFKNHPKKSKKEASYLPTEKGKPYCELVLSTGSNGDSTSYQQLRWYESILKFF